MDELLEHEGGQELELLLDGRDETYEKKVIQFDENQAEKYDTQSPEPVFCLSETEEVKELPDSVAGKQAC